MKTKKRNKVKEEITPEYLRGLKFKDFMGELTEEEIVIAEKYGIHRWNDYKKRRNAERLKQG